MTGLAILVIFGVISIITPAIGVTQQSIARDAQQLGRAPFMKPGWITFLDPNVNDPYWAINDTFNNNNLNGWQMRTDGNGSSITTGTLAPREGYQGDEGYKIVYNHTDPTQAYAVTHIYFEKAFTQPYHSAAGVAYGYWAKILIANPGNSTVQFTINLVNPQGVAYRMFPQFAFDLYNITTSTSWLGQPVQVSGISFYQEFLLNAMAGPGEVKMQFNITITNTKPTETTSVVAIIDQPGLFVFGGASGILGTDNSSQDLFEEFLLGTRISFLVGLVATFAAIGIGLLIGLFSGYVGGYTDELTMRVVDFVLILPTLPLLIVLAYILGAGGPISIWTIILVIGVLGWPGVARIVRSQVLSVKERSFVEASRAIGAPRTHIIFTHILPNVLGLVYALAATSVGGAILTESALSFIGLGDPTVISWGQMLHWADVYGAARVLAWWWIVPPGIGIALLSVSFIFIGHALDEIFNPKLRRR